MSLRLRVLVVGMTALGAGVAAWSLWAWQREFEDRYEAVDARIESMMPNQEAGGTLLSEGERSIIVVRLERGAAGGTEVRIDGVDGVLRIDDAEGIRAALREAVERRGTTPEAASMEIRSRAPHGDRISDADVIAVLNDIVGIGVTDVVFDGKAQEPRNAAERARGKGD